MEPKVDANLILGRTGNPDRVNTAPDPQEPPVDQLAELVRLINEDPKPEPPRQDK